MQPPSDRAMLWGFAASEAQSIAQALTALADQGRNGVRDLQLLRRYAMESSDMCLTFYLQWWTESGIGGVMPRSHEERLLLLRQWLTDHIDALEEMAGRLGL